MKSLFVFMFLSINLIGQSVVKDTIYLEWRNNQFFEVTETQLDNGQRQLNERPLGDSLTTIRSYVESTERVFNQLTDAVKIMIQRNAVISNVNKINTLLGTTFNQDLVSISTNIVKDGLQGDYKFKLPDTELIDAKVNEELVLEFNDKSFKIIPVGTSYIQLTTQDANYELYKIGEGQYASVDATIILFKQQTQSK